MTSPRISYIINTACLDGYAGGFRNPFRKTGYRSRYDLLTEKVLPAAFFLKDIGRLHEIIVAGTFESGSDYHYLPVPPVTRNRVDALHQREAGARLACGDLLIFGHDDHVLDAGFCAALETERQPWDLLVPRRVHGITGATLNNGSADGDKPPYMGGHVLAMRRWLWATVPWTLYNTEYWDTSMTRAWQQAGGKIVYSDTAIHYDVEASTTES